MNPYPTSTSGSYNARDMPNANMTPPATPSLLVEVEECAKSLHFLREVIGDLEQRLAPLLRSVGPGTAPATENAAQGSASVLIMALRNHRAELHSAGSHLRTLIDRIEL